jgi:hypothetical protein
MLPAESVLPLALFMALLMALSLQGLAASGQFPREHRSPALSAGVGPAILFASVGLAIVCLFVGLTLAWRLIPWYAAIIGGGAMVLAAPLVLQWFPDSFVDGRGALIAFAGAGAVLTLAMIVFLL